jgi:urea transporter
MNINVPHVLLKLSRFAPVQALRSMINSYSDLFFLKGGWIGIVILGLTLLNPNLGLSGLFSVFIAFLVARFLGYQQSFIESGIFTYNALLVGLSIGQLFSFSWLTSVYIAIASSITLLLTISLMDVFSRFFRLPILSIPFVIVSSLIYLSAARFTNLYVNELYATGHIEFLSNTFPLWINGFFKSMGAIIFMPDPLVGIIILLMIALYSRVLFLLAVVGYYFGILLQSFFMGSLTIAFLDLNAFNYPLIAMALGAVFNIPNIKSFLIAMMGVAGATVLIKSIDVFWSQYGLPVFTLPFIFITLVTVYTLGLVQYPFRPVYFKSTPEKTARFFYRQKIRFPQLPTFTLPFLDQWAVYQGFNGEWTHKGIWQYAYDFVKQDAHKKTYSGDGAALEDYYCFAAPVSSPTYGTVVYIENTQPDNPIGTVDNMHNWGNYVIISLSEGGYIGLCHLKQFSVIVQAGEWVVPYQVVGYCGNSGYSPEPHIHMQFQSTSFLTSQTLPFNFRSTIQNQSSYLSFSEPEEGALIEPVISQLFYQQCTAFILDEVLSFDVWLKDKLIESVQFTVKMALDGTFYFERNNSYLYFGQTETQFLFYSLDGDDPYLKLLNLALPSMPLNFIKKGEWQEVVSPEFYPKKRGLFETLPRWFHYKAEYNARYYFDSDLVIRGEVLHNGNRLYQTSIYLDPIMKITKFQVGEYWLIAR